MAALEYTIVHRGGARGKGLQYIVLEIDSADDADTVTVSEFDNAVKDTVAFQMDTGAAVACTESGKVVTIGGSVSDVPLVICVSGY